MRLEALRPTCRLTRCVVRATATRLSAAQPENAENVESGERRVVNKEWRMLLHFRIASDEIYKFSATFSAVSSTATASQGLPPPQRIRILWWAVSPWNTLLFLFLPALHCPASSGCRPTLAQLLPLPKVSHELESCCPWGSRTSVPEPVRRASQRLYWGNDSSLGHWRRSIKKMHKKVMCVGDKSHFRYSRIMKAIRQRGSNYILKRTGGYMLYINT